MSIEQPTPLEKETLQNLYLTSRNLVKQNVVGILYVQRSFDEIVGGFYGDNIWRPTHISHDAVRESIFGLTTNLQRAHGVVGERLDRYDRTVRLLTEPETDFDSWWEYWKKHDATVLITKSEHGSGKKFSFDELVEIPKHPADLFVRAGFSFKIRKKVELVWMQSLLSSGVVQSPEKAL